jgi:hypothetical protein
MTKADDIGKNAPTTLTERETTVAKAVQAFKDANSAHNKSLYSYILLGKALLKARQVCGANFYGEIKEDMVPKKQIQRYVRFVADESDEKCLETLSKVPAVTDKTNLKLDSKIDGIKESDLDTLKNPSMKKLALMKELDAKQFKQVMSGHDMDYDNLVGDKKDIQAKLTKIEKEKATAKLEKEFLNTGMTTEEFGIYKAGGDEAVKNYMEVKAEQKKLEKIIADKNQKLTDLRLEIKTKDKKLKDLQPPVKKAKAA